MSFPQATGQCPIYYNHYNTGRPHVENFRYVSRYQDIPTESYYPFGYGLSYSHFEYTNLKLSSNKITPKSPVTVTVQVKNNSEVAGKEVVQLYIQDLVANSVRPVKELKAFKKVYLEPWEEREVSFEITVDMLAFWNEKLEYKPEEGEFKVVVGSNVRDTICGMLELVDDCCL